MLETSASRHRWVGKSREVLPSWWDNKPRSHQILVRSCAALSVTMCVPALLLDSGVLHQEKVLPLAEDFVWNLTQLLTPARLPARWSTMSATAAGSLSLRAAPEESAQTAPGGVGGRRIRGRQRRG